MKKINLSLIFIIIISILALAISLPNFNFSVKDKNFHIRGLRLSDVTDNSVIGDFSFNRSLALHGGKRITYTVVLPELSAEEKSNVLNRIKDIIEARLFYLKIGEYNIYTLNNNEESKLVIETAFPLEADVLQKITAPGNVGVWAIDYNSLAAIQNGADPATLQDPYAGTIFQGRKQQDITNQDLAYGNVISDSNVFVAKEVIGLFPENELITEKFTKPANFGVKLFFTKEANSKLLNALATNPYGASPLIVTIDNEPVAIQASGSLQTQNSLLLYIFDESTIINNSLIASFFSTPVIENQVVLDSIDNLTPTYGTSLYGNIIIGSVLGFVLSQIVWIYYFQRRALFGVISNILFVIWTIGFLKLAALLSLTLDIGLILGFETALFIFTSYMALLTYRIRTKSQSGLLKEEILEVYNSGRIEFRNLMFFIIFLAFILQRYGTFIIEQYSTGLGFGVVGGFLVITFAVKPLISTLLLKLHK